MENEKKRVLVTGAGGLLGSAIRSIYDQYPDYEFVFLDHYHVVGDMSQQKRVKMVFGMFHPDYIIHCAAKVGGINLNLKYPETMLYENLTINSHIIHYAARHKVKHFMAFGSVCAYDESLTEINESNTQFGYPYPSNYAYGYAKRMLEMQLKAAKQEYKLNYSYFILPTLYGKGDNFNLDDAHVIPSLIHKCHLAKDEMKVWGDGSPLRDVLYANDVARIVLNSIDNAPEVVLVGSGREVSVKEMVENICQYMGFQGKITWDSDRPTGQVKRPQLKKYNFDFTSFEKGIEETCKWFKENYPNIRK